MDRFVISLIDDKEPGHVMGQAAGLRRDQIADAVMALVNGSLPGLSGPLAPGYKILVVRDETVQNLHLNGTELEQATAARRQMSGIIYPSPSIRRLR